MTRSARKPAKPVAGAPKTLGFDADRLATSLKSLDSGGQISALNNICLGIGQIDPGAPDMLPLKGLDFRQSYPGSTVVRFARVPSGR